MTKEQFDVPMEEAHYKAAQLTIELAQAHQVDIIINVGTNLVESRNCIELAKRYTSNYAVIGIHPNDATRGWRDDIKEMNKLAQQKDALKIVGIGECGMDFHYPDYNKQIQADLFRAQIELALNHDLALVVHTRDARDETLQILEEYCQDIKRGVIHCFSEDAAFARQVIAWGFVIGIGGTVTYPKNNELRDVTRTSQLSSIVLETDAPFLPPQSKRGTKNSPVNIPEIAAYIAQLKGIHVDEVMKQTTTNARNLFQL